MSNPIYGFWRKRARKNAIFIPADETVKENDDDNEDDEE